MSVWRSCNFINHSEEGGSNSEKEVSNENKDVFIASSPGYCGTRCICGWWGGRYEGSQRNKISARPALVDAPAGPAVVQTDPKQVLQDYDSLMIALTQKFSATLATIAD